MRSSVGRKPGPGVVGQAIGRIVQRGTLKTNGSSRTDTHKAARDRRRDPMEA